MAVLQETSYEQLYRWAQSEYSTSCQCRRDSRSASLRVCQRLALTGYKQEEKQLFPEVSQCLGCRVKVPFEDMRDASPFAHRILETPNFISWAALKQCEVKKL